MPIYTSTYTGDEIDENLGKAETALQAADIVNDLISTDTDKALSAAQGKALQDNKVPTALLADTKEPSGFLDPTAITVEYNSGAQTVTLTQTGGVVYYWRGEKKTLASPWTSTAHDEADGLYFLYSTDGTNFAWSLTPWSFEHVQVAFVSVSGSGTVLFALREVHGLMPWQTHKVLHDRIGTYRASGGLLTEDTFALDTATDEATTPGFESAVLVDEDLLSTVEPTTQGEYTTLRIGASGVATFDVGAAFPFRVADPNQVNTYILINDPATGGETATTNNRWANVYDILLPVAADSESQKYRRLLLQPQTTYASQAAAQAEDPRSLVLGTLRTLTPEFLINARLTYRTLVGNNENTGKVRLMAVTYLTGSAQSQVSVSFVGITAGNVGFTPAGRIEATNVQAALEELDNETSVAVSHAVALSF
jgi:hypothetical protein